MYEIAVDENIKHDAREWKKHLSAERMHMTYHVLDK